MHTGLLAEKELRSKWARWSMKSGIGRIGPIGHIRPIGSIQNFLDMH